MWACIYRCPPSRFPSHSSKAAKIMRTWSLILLLPLSAGCKGCQYWASFSLCLWIIPLVDPHAQTFYIHITDGPRQKSSERWNFSIYPQHRQTDAGCLGCYRHPGPSGKSLVIAWLLVCFPPSNLKCLWYLQKSHSSMCCGNTGCVHLVRELRNPVLQEKSESSDIASIRSCYTDSIPPSARQKATLPQYPWSVSKVTWKAQANWISISSNSSIWVRPDTAVAVSAAERPQKMQKYIKGKKVTHTSFFFFFLNFTKSFSAEAWDSSYFSLNQLFSLNTWTLVCFCLWSERTCLKASSREVQSQMLWFKPLCSHPWKKMRRSSLVWRQR